MVKTVMADKQKTKTESLSYVAVPEALPKPPENFRDKFIRRTTENPLVPIGLLATIGILGNGIMQMRKGNQAGSQRMMRARVLVQGFTVFALVAGVYMAGKKEGQKDKIE